MPNAHVFLPFSLYIKLKQWREISFILVLIFILKGGNVNSTIYHATKRAILPSILPIVTGLLCSPSRCEESELCSHKEDGLACATWMGFVLWVYGTFEALRASCLSKCEVHCFSPNFRK